jgi:hypothetical protein
VRLAGIVGDRDVAAEAYREVLVAVPESLTPVAGAAASQQALQLKAVAVKP